MKHPWNKRPRWQHEGQHAFNELITAFKEMLPAAMPRQTLVGYHHQRRGTVFVVEVLACGHEGQRGDVALIEQWIAEGKTRPCPQCTPAPPW
jgi:hypothetical protein